MALTIAAPTRSLTYKESTYKDPTKDDPYGCASGSAAVLLMTELG